VSVLSEVGVDVIGVTIHAQDLTIQASVANRRYTAWWPEPASHQDGKASSGKATARPSVTYDLTLRDGTVINDAQPDRPR
jgi:hypothetical protein